MELWSPQHIQTLLPALVVMLLACIGLRAWLGKKDIKIRMIPLQIAAVLFLLLEVGKQVVSFSRGYDLYHIPLHFCSLILFTLPVMAFYKGKYAQGIRSVATAVCCAVFWLTAIYPCLIYSAGNIDNFFNNYLDFHTVAFHNLAMFAFLMILFLDLHTPSPKGEHKRIVLFLTTFCVVAAVVSQLLETNYAGFYQCNVGPIEEVRLMLQPVIGYWPAQLIYVGGLTAVHYGFVIGFYCIYKLLRRLLTKKTPAAV
jgi:hypothetical protein